MTVDSAKPDRIKWLGSNLVLGLLVTILSVFTAVANYATYVVGGNSSGYETEGDRLLSDANTSYISASQFVIVDYAMYDSYYTSFNTNVDVADYYKSLFSDSLKSSVDRDAPFDDRYFDEMYADSDAKFDEAFAKFDLANAEGEREAGYQLAMLVTAVGLAFAAYASLLDEANRLRRIFALMSLIMLILSVGQFLMVSMG
jgi:hypothetical protein